MKETLAGASSGTIDPPVERAGVYDRPSARFDWEGQLEVRASAASRLPARPLVRRHGPRARTAERRGVDRHGDGTRPGAGCAARHAAGGLGGHSRRREAHPTGIVLQLTPVVKVTGHPDATGRMPLFGGEAVIEVKTRGPSAFKRWQALGAERSHPRLRRPGGALHLRALRGGA